MLVLTLILAQIIGPRPEAPLSAPTCDTVVSAALARPWHSDTLHVVYRCPARFGPTFAALLRDPRVRGDSSLSDLVVSFAATRKEPETFQVAFEMARDTANSIRDRIDGMAIMAEQVGGDGVIEQLPWIRAVSDTFPGFSCGPLAAADVSRAGQGDRPLPDDAGLLALELGVATDKAHPAGPLGCMANVLLWSPGELRDERAERLGMLGYSGTVPDRPPPDFRHDVTYRLACGRQVVILNRSPIYPYSMNVSWGRTIAEVHDQPTDDGWDLTALPKPPDAETSVWRYTIPDSAARYVQIRHVRTHDGSPPWIYVVGAAELDRAPCPEDGSR